MPEENVRMGLAEKIESKQAIIAVVGLGYVGLPLAVGFARAGFHVVGIDTNPRRVGMVMERRSYIEDVPDVQLASVPNLIATGNQSALAEADIAIVCVPTPLTKTKDPDLTYVIRESEEIARYLHVGQLIILESTTYPGTTRDVVKPILDSVSLPGRYYLGYSPEMVDPGNKRFGLWNTPKVVSGMDSESLGLVEQVYKQVAKTVIPVSSPEVAEMVKVYTNVFRMVNIALPYELARLCRAMRISVWEVLNTAAQKPFGYMPFYPGPGIGGHCICLDPYYLSCKAREFDFHTRFIELAADITEQMPYYVVEQVESELNKREKTLGGSRVLVLGVAYKKDVGDCRESPSLKLIELLSQEGAEVSYHDPLVPEISVTSGEKQSIVLDECSAALYDCVIIAVDHTWYVNLVNSIVQDAWLVYDTKGITYGIDRPNVVRLGE